MAHGLPRWLGGGANALQGKEQVNLVGHHERAEAEELERLEEERLRLLETGEDEHNASKFLNSLILLVTSLAR